MICKKCLIDFPENEIESSHDIPKYMGGTDKDGRHYLCVDCHSKYDRMVLARCFLLIFNQTIPFSENRKTYVSYMGIIKRANFIIQDKCRKITLQCKEEFYLKKGDENDGSLNT